jgi:hypothetical protein
MKTSIKGGDMVMLDEKVLNQLKSELNFKSEETFLKFKYWICGSPESYHPCDMERWCEWLLSVFENNDDINWSVIIKEIPKHMPAFSVDDIDNYITKFESMRDFYNLMVENGYKKILNEPETL